MHSKLLPVFWRHLIRDAPGLSCRLLMLIDPMIREFGPDWLAIAQHLPGRTDASIQEQWGAIYRRRGSFIRPQQPASLFSPVSDAQNGAVNQSEGSHLQYSEEAESGKVDVSLLTTSSGSNPVATFSQGMMAYTRHLQKMAPGR